MSWMPSVLSATAASVVGGIGGIALGASCVKWYKISSFEGKSGFAIAGMLVAGVVVGGVAGLVATRVAVANGHDSGGSQLLAAVAAVLALLVVSTVVAFILGRRVP